MKEWNFHRREWVESRLRMLRMSVHGSQLSDLMSLRISPADVYHLDVKMCALIQRHAEFHVGSLSATVEVAGGRVRLVFGENLPKLSLRELQGNIDWKELSSSFMMECGFVELTRGCIKMIANHACNLCGDDVAMAEVSDCLIRDVAATCARFFECDEVDIETRLDPDSPKLSDFPRVFMDKIDISKTSDWVISRKYPDADEDLERVRIVDYDGSLGILRKIRKPESREVPRAVVVNDHGMEGKLELGEVVGVLRRSGDMITIKASTGLEIELFIDRVEIIDEDVMEECEDGSVDLIEPIDSCSRPAFQNEVMKYMEKNQEVFRNMMLSSPVLSSPLIGNRGGSILSNESS